MGWVDKPHRCALPLVVHGSVGMVGAHFECDHCKVTWKVQARVLIDSNTYGLTFIRRVGDYLYTISWQEY